MSWRYLKMHNMLWCSHSAIAPPKWVSSWKIRQSCLDSEKLTPSVLFCKGLDSMCESFTEVPHWVRVQIISSLSLCPYWIWPCMAKLSISRTHDYPNPSKCYKIMMLKSCVTPRQQKNKHVLPMWTHDLTIGQLGLQIGGNNPIN